MESSRENKIGWFRKDTMLGLGSNWVENTGERKGKGISSLKGAFIEVDCGSVAWEIEICLPSERKDNELWKNERVF